MRSFDNKDEIMVSMLEDLEFLFDDFSDDGDGKLCLTYDGEDVYEFIRKITRFSMKNREKLWSIKLFDTKSKTYHVANMKDTFFAISADGTRLLYCRNGRYTDMLFPIENLEIQIELNINQNK